MARFTPIMRRLSLFPAIFMLPLSVGAGDRRNLLGSGSLLFNAPLPSLRNPVSWCFVLRGRRDPGEEANARLKKLEEVVLNVVASQAQKIRNLEMRAGNLERKIEALQLEVDDLKRGNADEEEVPWDSTEMRSPSPGENAQEAFAAFADVLLRTSISDSNRGYLGGSSVALSGDSALNGDVQGVNAADRNTSSAPLEQGENATGTTGMGFGRRPGMPGDVVDEESEMRRRSHEGRLREALDVPDDLYDAADSSGSALLAALLCGHRRMLVNVADVSLDRTVQPNAAKAAPGDLGDSMGSQDEGGGDDDDDDDDDDDNSNKASERLARFVELMALPIVAALEGLGDSMERSRVHVMFHGVRQLASARRVMAYAADSGVGLGALSLDTSLDDSDGVVVIVAPIFAEGGDTSDNAELTALLKSAENRTIIVVNPEQALEKTLFADYEPVYVLKGMHVHYLAKKTLVDSDLESRTIGAGTTDDPDRDTVDRQPSLVESAASEWADSTWGDSSEMLGDFYSDELEAQVMEQELGLSTTDNLRRAEMSEPCESSGGGGTECPPTLRTEEWVAAAAAAVSASTEEESSGFAGYSVDCGDEGLTDIRGRMDPDDQVPELSQMVPRRTGDDDLDFLVVDNLQDVDPEVSVQDLTADEEEPLESEARAMLLREFPMPWRTFLQLSEDSIIADGDVPVDENSEEFGRGLEQPWIFVESFEGRPSRSDVNLAILSYIDEAMEEEQESDAAEVEVPSGP